jgi:hypothetical protein
MKPFIYLWAKERELYKEDLKAFYNIYKIRISPVFNNIEDEANIIRDNFYNNIAPSITESADVASELAFSAGNKFYSTHKLAQYQYLLSTIVLLFQLWEQQVRKFLYNLTYAPKRG